MAEHYTAEELAAAGYAHTEPRTDIDRQVTRAYEASLRRKRDAVQGAIEYLCREWPSVIRTVESEAARRAIEGLIIAFRRWCLSNGQVAPPSVEEFRDILLVAAEIRADLDMAEAKQ